MQNIDERTKNQIIEQIKEKSLSYVPEWRMEEGFPDIGTALALVYAELFSKTLKRLNQVPLKNRIAFLNELDAKLLPALPAEGYVTFSLVNEEAEGVEIREGTVVNAQSEDDGIGVVSYQTVDDVFVTPARLSSIYSVCDRTDSIFQLWDGTEPFQELTLFDQKGQNLQEHQLYFCHREALCIKEEGFIQIRFARIGEGETTNLPEALLQKLMDRNCVRFEYYSQEGYQEFAHQQKVGETLLFQKEKGQPPFEWRQEEGTEGYFIRCRVLDIKELKDLEFSKLHIRSYGTEILPDSVYADGVESVKKRYFPFGERLTNFGEVYFASEETLCKKGASVELAFHLSFAKIPLDFNVENDPVKWQWIMKRSDFKPDPEFDITIESVIWEYYNGVGWGRLFPDDRYEDLFYPKEGTFGQYQTIRFVCPQDMAKVTINSCESYYIRARIIKVNNFFKMKGAYISPVLENTIFQYDYKNAEVAAEEILSWNNREFDVLTASETQPMGEKRPFIQTGEERQALYLGFQKAPEQGPLKCFFLLKDNLNRKNGMLIWEYYDGSRWKEINLVDETQNFEKSGIVTFMGEHDFAKKRLFGEELYWIRIIDGKDFYQQRNKSVSFPVAEGIFLNTTKIVNVDHERTEYFRMELYQENMRFTLPEARIISAKVFVNEMEGLDEEERSRLREEERLFAVYDDAGILMEAWVLWDEVEDFVEIGSEDRVYVLNRNEGYVVFGNGKRGRIPPSSRNDNIRIEYRQGGGEHTNMPVGRVNQMDQEIGFINGVRNPVALMGGCGVESLSDALWRNSAAIRHQNRGVTVRDFEELAMSASRSIQRAKCFFGYDGQGKRQPGAVTLVVIQKKYESGKTRFNEIKETVERYLSDKISGDLVPGERLFVIEPEFVYLDVRAELMVKDFNNVFQVKKQVQERIQQFLNPFSGNFHGRGWEIGRLPGKIQIKNAVADTPGVNMVKNIYISAFTEESAGRREIDLEKGEWSRYVLPVSGKQEVIIHIG